MTWMGLFSRMASLLVVLPFVLRQFSEGDVSLYFLLFSAIAFQTMFASGLVSSFSRYVSYALAGANLEDLKGGLFYSGGVSGNVVSKEVIGLLRGTMRRVFLVSALVAFFSISLIGSVLLWKPIQFSSNATESWMAWAVILFVSPVSFYGMRFNAFLQGADEIALEQRWAAIFGILATVTSVLILMMKGGLFELIAANQFWLLVSYFRNRYLEKRIADRIGYSKETDRFDGALFMSLWPQTWRSIFGILILNGIVHASGFLYAQFIEPVKLAGYLLAVRLVTAISILSRPPFYSKIPVFNRLRAEGDIAELKRLAYRTMNISHILYLLGVICVALLGGWFLEVINSNTAFPEILLWSLLSLSFFLERFGAMHLQIYSTTNHIVWHTATGVSGGIALVLTLLFIGYFDVYSFPLAMIAGHLCYYATVVPILSKRSLRENTQ